ncbi:hypothetical protein [Sphingomonas soli]|uniref:hypothetical protein n=1 Tax=Sphingomonas soli TaxID=266127 RepID=UPI000830CAC6|nr:hypothetical protein [Sphingomonas soli]
MRKLLVFFAFLLCPLSASAQWRQAVSDHFVIYAEGDYNWIRNFAEELERFDRGARRLRNLPDSPTAPATKVTVYVISSSSEFTKLAGSNRIGGFYLARESGARAFLPKLGGTDNMRQTLFHEYTHHLYMVAWANVAIPGWLQEGLAEFHSSAEFNKDGSLVIGREPATRYWQLSELTTDQIRKMLLMSKSASGVDVYYSGGWLLTHFLTFAPGRENQIGSYIAAINKGKSLGDAAEEAFGDTGKLGSDLARYRRGTGLRAVVVPKADLQIGQITVRPLTAAETSTIQIRIQSDRGVNEKTRDGVYALAKAAAAPYPNDAAAQRVLTEAAYDAKDFVEAEAAADRAIAADPKLGSAYAYKAMAMIARANADKDNSAPRWTAIRKVIAEGKRIDPDNPELLMMFYRSFAQSGMAPNQPAKQALYRAVVLAPQVGSIRFTAAMQLIRDGLAVEAKSVLRPLAFNPHSQKSAERARNAIEEIDKGNLEGASKALAGGEEPDEEETPPSPKPEA